MHCEVFPFLQAGEVDRIVRDLAKRTFADGKSTALGRAREVKHNLQVERTGSERTEIDDIVATAFTRNRDFQAFAMPSRFVMPIISRYEPGMTYGAHVDNSLMGGFNGLRTDLAMTIFLTPPASYDGGELVIHEPAGEEEIKLDCGEAIVYPATSVHHVAPVTRGVRLAAVTWIQSAVHDERVRAILYDLSHALIQAEKEKNHSMTLLLSKSYHNLVRYAAEP
jgi:PKHD-type hydroxylase